MSTSRKSKKDIDRYVRQIDEKERSGRGYQIALLYYEVAEYDLAKRYLADYMSLRETIPQAHKLMGRIFEATKEWEQAAGCYKRSLELDNKQKELILKVCELYSKMPNTDIERLRYWCERAEKHYPTNKVVFAIKEKILTTGSGGSVEEMEDFYGQQLVENFSNVTLHIKLLDLYMNAERVEDAYKHTIEVENTLAFVNNLEWNEHLPRVFHAYQKKELCANNLGFHKHKLFMLCNLLKLQLQDKDIVTCASTLHQFDQALYESYQINSKKPEWTAIMSEMQGQYFFTMGVLLLKRAQKAQQSWKDANSFSSICFLLSNYYPVLDIKSSWYVQGKPEDKKFFEKLQKAGCYRLSQGGHMLLSQNDGAAKLQHLKHNLRTIQARDKLYDVMFTLREMRDKKDRSFLTKTDIYCKTALVLPSALAVSEWDNVVHQDCIENLHEQVWIGLNKYSLKDKIQPDYGMKMFDKLPYRDDLSNGTPENLDGLDVQGFFYATVRCAAYKYEEQSKVSRSDPFKLFLLPACLTSQLVTKQQVDWWEAVCKFHMGTARENFARLRITLQRGIETVRLLGSHGMSVSMIVHLARTFGERLKEEEKQVEEGQQGLDSRIRALQCRVVHYWKEGLAVLSKMQKNMPIRMPKDRMFSDSPSTDCDSNQVQYLIDQAKFAIATISMKKGQFEEAKEQFEKLNQPLSSYNLSQIYRKMSDTVSSSDPEVMNQKVALLESALDALYLTHDRLKGDKNDELSRKIPADIDDVVNQLERLRTSGPAFVDSISAIDDGENDSHDDTPSFSTPQGHDHIEHSFHGESPSFIQAFEKEHSTPAIKSKSKSPAKVLSFSEISLARPRPSPERLEAKIWALEHKQQTIMDLLHDIKDRSNEMNRVIREVREEQETYRDVVKQMRDYMAIYPPTHGQMMNPPFAFPPYGYPPHAPPQPQQQPPWMPPSNLGYSMQQRPASNFSSPARFDRFPVPSHQNDIVEDDIYHVDGEYYEDDGSQPIPSIYGGHDVQLEQNWPFGNRAGLEGKATVTYSPQGRPIPQPGFFAQALRGQALQYGLQQPGAQIPPQPRNPLNLQPPSATASLPPGVFSQSPQVSFTPQYPSTKTFDAYQNAGSCSQPSALMAALQGPTTMAATTSMPPNAVATSSVMTRPSLIQSAAMGTTQGSVTIGQGQSVFGTFTSVTPATSGSPMPLFGSLVAAAKSPSADITTASPLSSFVLRPSTSPAGVSGFPSFAGIASASADVTAFKGQEGLRDSGQPLFIKGDKIGKSPTKSPSKYGAGDDDHLEEFEPSVEFKPVIDLPDLVDVKTGEEEEEKLFGQRGKLFRFDPENKQWKERGVGEMKILKHKQNGRVRILMRRDQVLKLCANHYLSKELKLTPMPSSDKAWCWTAMDYSEEELRNENLCIRFKTQEIAADFKETFEKCQKELSDTTDTAEKISTTKPDTTSEGSKSRTSKTDQPKLKDLFKPKSGTWSCGTCLVSNDASVVKCAACATPKPGVKPEQIKPEKPKPAAAASGKPSLKEMFKPKSGTWSCDTCLVTNSADVLKCAACQTLKHGVKPEDVKDEKSDKPKLGGFSFGGGASSSAATGFKFGDSGKTAGAPAAGGFKFGESKPATGSGFLFGQTTQPAKTTEGGGFKFGDKGGTTTGFSFGQSAPTTQKPGDEVSKQTEKAVSFPKPTAVPVKPSKKSGDKPAGSDISFLPPTTESKPAAGAASGSGFNFATPTSGFKFGQNSATSETPSFGKPKEDATKQKEEGAQFSFTITDTHSDDESKEPETRTGTFTFNPAKDFSSSTVDKPAFTVTPAKTEDKGDTSPFKFTFTIKPTPETTGKEQSIKSPKPPETDPEGMYVNKEGEDDHIYFEPLVKLDHIEVVTGEEDEEALYDHRAKLYRFVNGEWKERGLGNIKILENKETKQIRLLMRREKIHKVCCNHCISPELDLKPMPKADGKAWVWFAMDGSEGEPQCEQFSIRFKTADIASEFKAAFDSAKEKVKSGSSDTPKKSEQTEPPSPSNTSRKLFTGEDPEVIFVREEKATDEQVRRAREFLLPDNFYLYESKPPCPGCAGCDDGESVIPKICSPDRKQKDQTSSGSSIFGGVAAGSSVYGGSSKIFGSTESPSSGGGLFGSGTTSTVSTGSIFGTATSSSKTTGSVFGSGTTSSVFGSGATTSAFGSASTDRVFGGEKSSGATPVFGLAVAEKSSGGTSVLEVASGDKSSGGTPVFGLEVAEKLPGGTSVFGSTGGEQLSGGTSVFGSSATESIFGKGAGESEFSFASLAAHSDDAPTAFKKDENKPFKWAGAGQSLFKSANETGDGHGGDEDDDDVVQGHDPHFEPIVPLPDLVEVKTGEEDEDIIFAHRAKLFRFDKDVNQWKEKGIGEMKILKCRQTCRYRLLLRREQVYKLACNHALTPDLDIQPLPTSETSYCWVSEDFSENEGRVEQFAVRFKTIDLARKFKERIDECQEDLRNRPDIPIPVTVAAVSEIDDKHGIQATDDRTEGGVEEVQQQQEEDDDDDDEEYETEEEEEEIIFEKRVTFCSKDKGQSDWKVHGPGDLKVTYDEDVNGNRVIMQTDKEERVCNHLIAKECTINFNQKQKYCEWSAIDFSTDEAVRRDFRAQFSSGPAVEEFQTVFQQGRSLAVDSDISERDMIMMTHEMAVPEVHSHNADPDE